MARTARAAAPKPGTREYLLASETDGGVPRFLQLDRATNARKHPGPLPPDPSAPKPDRRAAPPVVVDPEPTVLERAMLDPRFDLVPDKVWRMLPRRVDDVGLLLLFREYESRAARREASKERTAEERAATREAAPQYVTLRQLVTDMSVGREKRVKRRVAAKILAADGPEPAGGWKFAPADVEGARYRIEAGLAKAEGRAPPPKPESMKTAVELAAERQKAAAPAVAEPASEKPTKKVRRKR